MPDPKDSLFTGVPEQKKEEPKPESKLPEPLQGKPVEEVYDLLRQAHEQEMREKEAALQAQQPVQPVYQPPVQPAPQPVYTPPIQQETPNYYSDPDKFLEDQVTKRVAPLVDAFQQSSRQMAREVFKQTVPQEEWDKYQTEVEQFVAQVHPSVLAQNPIGAYKAAITYVKGMHIDDIIKERSRSEAKNILKEVMAETGMDDGKLNSFFESQQPQPRTSLFQPNTGTIPKTAPARNFNPNSTAAKPQLSDEQKRVAAKFGMTEAEYAEWEKEDPSEQRKNR